MDGKFRPWDDENLGIFHPACRMERTTAPPDPIADQHLPNGACPVGNDDGKPTPRKRPFDSSCLGDPPKESCHPLLGTQWNRKVNAG